MFFFLFLIYLRLVYYVFPLNFLAIPVARSQHLPNLSPSFQGSIPALNVDIG